MLDRSTGGFGPLGHLAMALLALAAGAAASRAADDPAPVVNQVKLDVQISGVGAAGCKIEIRPANPACKFEPVVQEIAKTPASGVIRLDDLDIAASSLSADRECTFSIVVTEPGAKPLTFKRSVRLQVAKNPGDDTPEIEQTFYLRNTVVASKNRPRP
jgi:hypothetical protein